MRLLLILLSLTTLTACGWFGFPGVYRLDIEQGNIVTQEMAGQLQPGMTKRQVRFILGTPLVEDTPENIKGHPKVKEAYLGETQ